MYHLLLAQPTLSPISTVDPNDIPGPSQANTSVIKSILSTPQKVTLSKKRTESINSLAIVLKEEFFRNRGGEESRHPKTPKN